MQEMEKSYQSDRIEAHWYGFWESQGYFAPAGDGAPYCIMLPPPNVTGSLHMGHAFQDTIMDVLTRFNRMDGKRALWQCGTDHAGIATQMVVERQLADQGESRHDLGREGFVDRVWQWKEQSGGRIKDQMRRLGTSVDWENERFTMDEGLSRAVRKVFISLHKEGLIYRGKRLVNWDPKLHTALSDLEVVSEEEQGHLWHLRYPRSDGNGYVIVATTRPETMLGDAAVAVHPEDERYLDLVGKTLDLPLTGRQIKVIADDYVDPEFGSGCVKITPAHDFNDNEMGQRHGLDVIGILTPDACINDSAPEAYRGMDRFVARKQIVADFEALGLLEKVESHQMAIPRGDRSGAVLEPMLTDQWYVKTGPLAGPAIEVVKSGRLKFVPENWSKTYFEWMDNIQDWCISRQLWWGHRIPAWYDEQGGIYVGNDEAEVRAENNLGPEIKLRQDPDVLDTWFSSALWPFSTLGWPEKTPRVETFYPGNVLVTGFDIIFFWVARMVMMGLKFMGDIPFHEVYIHGLIKDGQGQKMSKSKGNVLDPIDLIDSIDLEALVKKRTTGLMQPKMAPKIEKATREEFPDGIKAHGTDALRFTFAALATTGRDIRFDMGRIEGYRNFCNKIWNAARFVMLNVGDSDRGSAPAPEHLSVADRWIISRLQQLADDIRGHIKAYRLDLYAQAIYDFIWNEYCDWYLELSKATLQGQGTAETLKAGKHTLLSTLESSMRLVHPIMPYISEEIWQKVAPMLGNTGDSIMLQPFPAADASLIDSAAEADIEWLKLVLLGIRRIRSEMNISPGKPLKILVRNASDSDKSRLGDLHQQLTAVGRVTEVEILQAGATAPESAAALVGEMEVLIPLAGLINKEEEIARLNRELAKHESDLALCQKKLSNSRFVENAPEAVVTKERGRVQSNTTAIAKLQAQISSLEQI